MDLLKLSAYDYNLPKELIAQEHAYPADTSRLLYFSNWRIKDLIFKDIEKLLSSNDVLFLNNSKVVKARITGLQDLKQDLQDKKWNWELIKGNKYIENDDIFFLIIWQDWKEKLCKNCEILFLKKIDNDTFEALVRPWKKFKMWTKIKIIKNNISYDFEVINYTKEWRIIKYYGNEDIFKILEKIWKMPLPPYITYSKDKEKPYQPIQAKKFGSVAAPTASLHFTNELIEKLKNKWIDFYESTLHIWMWTFKTVDVEDIENYDIHSEMVEVPIDMFQKIWNLKDNKKNIVAVGTTSTRILESLPYLYKKLENNNIFPQIRNNFFDLLNIDWKEVEKFIEDDYFIENGIIYFNTKLYIYPWFSYKIVDKLITNFHLPKSSLLMLVAAFMWYDNMMKVYKHAIEKKYRFFSFGDAMFVDTKF